MQSNLAWWIKSLQPSWQERTWFTTMAWKGADGLMPWKAGGTTGTFPWEGVMLRGQVPKVFSWIQGEIAILFGVSPVRHSRFRWLEAVRKLHEIKWHLLPRSTCNSIRALFVVKRRRSHRWVAGNCAVVCSTFGLSITDLAQPLLVDMNLHMSPTTFTKTTPN